MSDLGTISTIQSFAKKYRFVYEFDGAFPTKILILKFSVFISLILSIVLKKEHIRMVGNGRGQCLPGNLRRTDGYMPIPFLKSLLFAAIWFLLLVCTIPTSVAESASGPAITLTTDERAWLAAHPDIRLAYPPGHEPTLMRNDDGRLVGILADFWNLLNTRMGTNCKLELVPWLEVDDLIKQNRIDGLAIATPKRIEALGYRSRSEPAGPGG